MDNYTNNIDSGHFWNLIGMAPRAGCIGSGYCRNCDAQKTGTCLCAMICPDCKSRLSAYKTNMNLIEFKGKKYPAFQAQGHAMQFAAAYAKHFCKADESKGEFGYDLGYNREEWKFPGAIGIDLTSGGNALALPKAGASYIVSSHLLEHLPNYVEAIEHWTKNLNQGGILFLYLPYAEFQEYWLPQNNRKHIHQFTPQLVEKLMQDFGYINIFKSGVDLNGAFMIVGEKA